MRSQKFAYIGSIITIILAIGVLLLFFYWAFYPYHIIDYDLPSKVLNENHEVVRGELLHFRVEYEKYIPVNGNGATTLHCADGKLVTVLPPRGAGALFPLGEHSIDFDMIVPEKTSLGICHLESMIFYEVNPIREVPVHIYTENFEVIQWDIL